MEAIHGGGHSVFEGVSDVSMVTAAIARVDLLIGQAVDQPMELVPCGCLTGDDTYRRRWLRNVSGAHVDNLLVAAATFANL